MKYFETMRAGWFLALGILVGAVPGSGEETLPPLAGREVPQTVEALWDGYDPRAEALEVEVLKEWEEDGVVMRVVRYRVGVFKGERAMMAGIYGFPKGGEKLPGLVQIHGGGQYADHKAVLTNAKRGYATISIAWAGRISAPGYRVGPGEVKLFWDGATDDPNYKVTTDWGAVDGYHAPARNPGNIFPKLPVGEWTLDAVESPRNCGWFLCTLGARRAITFLERQAEVDGERIGVYGHSMGGKLTVMTTGSDPRVKAAAPSCGGMSDRTNSSALFRATIGDDAYLPRISCPVVFLSPANDFHGRIDDLQSALGEIASEEWRVTCAPHHNHQDTAEYEVATQLWFDEHLKGTFEWPETPGSELRLESEDGVPFFVVKPDGSKPVISVDVFYTQQGQMDGERNDMEQTKHRFWHHAEAVKEGKAWMARLPVSDTERPLWVYANVVYPIGEAVTGAGYYYGSYTTERFNVSSRMAVVAPGGLAVVGVKATFKGSAVIETFGEGWEKEWFTYRSDEWPRRTHKVYEPVWVAPAGAKLVMEVRSKEANTLVVGIDQTVVEVALDGGTEWQRVELEAGDFQDVEEKSRGGWDGIKELRLGHEETLRERRPERRRKVGGAWRGEAPRFRDLGWEVE